MVDKLVTLPGGRTIRVSEDRHQGPGEPEMHVVPGPGVDDQGPRDLVSEAEKMRADALVKDRKVIAEADRRVREEAEAKRKAEKEREALEATERTSELQAVARAAYLEAGGSPLHFTYVWVKMHKEFMTKYVHRRMAQWCDSRN